MITDIWTYLWDGPLNKKHRLSTAAYITCAKIVPFFINHHKSPIQLSKGSNRRCWNAVGHVSWLTHASTYQVFEGKLDSLAVATIKTLTTVMHKSPAAKVSLIDTHIFQISSVGTNYS